MLTQRSTSRDHSTKHYGCCVGLGRSGSVSCARSETFGIKFIQIQYICFRPQGSVSVVTVDRKMTEYAQEGQTEHTNTRESRMQIYLGLVPDHYHTVPLSI